MKHFGLVLIFGLALFLPCPTRALTFEPGADAPTRMLSDYIKDYVDIPKGATDWKLFGTTKEINVEGKTADGFDFQYTKPEFSSGLQKLNGQKITVKGFMFPLEGTEKQKLFLFGPFPVNCPYQYHVGASLVIEVHADADPVKFSYDPIIMTGTLELVEKDPEYSVFYRLKNARLSR